jgi:hypothetical protein
MPQTPTGGEKSFAARFDNHLTGWGGGDRYFKLKTCEIAVPNKDAWGLLYDFQIISDIAKVGAVLRGPSALVLPLS